MATNSMPLNNDGDTITLLDPNGQTLSVVSYDQAQVSEGTTITF